MGDAEGWGDDVTLEVAAGEPDVAVDEVAGDVVVVDAAAVGVALGVDGATEAGGVVTVPSDGDGEVAVADGDVVSVGAGVEVDAACDVSEDGAVGAVAAASSVYLTVSVTVAARPASVTGMDTAKLRAVGAAEDCGPGSRGPTSARDTTPTMAARPATRRQCARLKPSRARPPAMHARATISTAMGTAVPVPARLGAQTWAVAVKADVSPAPSAPTVAVVCPDASWVQLGRSSASVTSLTGDVPVLRTS
ncbi:MAG: hypothetical protein LBR33_02970 [Propionibacteriaceae bacterium]|nr:hypothetical protein [Propionibacteriaceae bacterium]